MDDSFAYLGLDRKVSVDHVPFRESFYSVHSNQACFGIDREVDYGWF